MFSGSFRVFYLVPTKSTIFYLSAGQYIYIYISSKHVFVFPKFSVALAELARFACFAKDDGRGRSDVCVQAVRKPLAGAPLRRWGPLGGG